MIRSISTVFVLMALTVSPAAAEVAREIMWDDLVPAATPLKNPFAHLTIDQSMDLESIAWARAMKEQAQITEVSPEYEDAVTLTHKLRAEGLDVNALLAQYAELNAEIARRNETVVGDLEGQLVRLPGYALPLEFTETGVKEFLLVPYIGACIHVPPPPPNQMVFVRLNQAFKADDLYTPVWITGRITVKRSSQSLSFVDGQSNIATGYTLDGIKVEPYKE